MLRRKWKPFKKNYRNNKTVFLPDNSPVRQFSVRIARKTYTAIHGKKKITLSVNSMRSKPPQFWSAVSPPKNPLFTYNAGLNLIEEPKTETLMLNAFRPRQFWACHIWKPRTGEVWIHSNAASYIHWKVCQNYNIMTSEDKLYEQKPETVVENEQAAILCNKPIHTDRRNKGQ